MEGPEAVKLITEYAECVLDTFNQVNRRSGGVSKACAAREDKAALKLFRGLTGKRPTDTEKEEMAEGGGTWP
jgi:hypothetical protein